MLYKSYYTSPIGIITLASDGKALNGLWIEGQKHYLGKIKEEMILNDKLDVFIEAKRLLNQYFLGKHPDFSGLDLSPMGSEFEKIVWSILLEIPYGKTTTYKEVASRVADKMNVKNMSFRAIGRAVGHNPISIIIPCHRVVGSNGSLTGYAGGIEKKISLLKLEGVTMDKLFIPKTKKL